MRFVMTTFAMPPAALFTSVVAIAPLVSPIVPQETHEAKSAPASSPSLASPVTGFEMA